MVKLVEQGEGIGGTTQLKSENRPVQGSVTVFPIAVAVNISNQHTTNKRVKYRLTL